MLKLDEKNYDVNNLLGINFDILKEVLLKLSQNQNNIQIEIKDLKDSNEERDKKILELENKIKELNNLFINRDHENQYEILKLKENLDERKNYEEKDRYNEDDEKNKKENEDLNKNENILEDININNENNEENKNNKNEVSTNNINKDELFESINIETKIHLVEHSIKGDNINIIPKLEFNAVNEKRPKTQEGKDVNNKMEEEEKKTDIKPTNFTFYKEKDYERRKEKRPIYKTSKEIIDLNSAVLQKSQVSYDVIRNILHTITEINEKMNYLEIELQKKFDESKQFSNKKLSEHNTQSMSKFNSINKKLADLYSKNDEYREKLVEIELKFEEIASKKQKPEIIQIFNEDDNQQKIMSSTFKESINRKFELNENRYMKAYGDSYKLQQKYITIKNITDKLTRQINLLRDDYNRFKENIDVFKKETNELINNKSNELKNDIKEELDKNLEDVNNNIDKKTRELFNLVMEENNTINKDINKDKNIDINSLIADKALIKLLNKKVSDLNEKIVSIEEEIKNQKKRNITKNKELDDVKQCIVELYDTINSKIGKDDLKELYGFYLEHVNEIKFIRAKLGEVSEMQDKIRNDTPNFIKRLESLTHDISELQESDKKKVVGTREKPVDLSNYVNEKKLKNTLSPMAEEIEKLISESEYMSKTLSDISDQIKSFEKKEHVDHIESELNEKINFLNNRYSKRFIEKIEFNKIIKNIDIQIKLLQGNMNHKKEEADNWLLAKQSLKCFNCATCEANIANSSPPNEYLPWNKYPQGEKQYRIGQGFSKLLKKLNKNIEDSNKNDKKIKLLDNSFENESSNRFLISSINNINEFIKINNRLPLKEEKGGPINIKKYKLPKVIESFRKRQKSNNEAIPMTDDEKENEEAFIENEIEINSPKILKITKLKSDNEQTQNEQEITKHNSRNKAGKSYENKLSRIQSVPFY